MLLTSKSKKETFFHGLSTPSLLKLSCLINVWKMGFYFSATHGGVIGWAVVSPCGLSRRITRWHCQMMEWCKSWNIFAQEEEESVQKNNKSRLTTGMRAKSRHLAKDSGWEEQLAGLHFQMLILFTRRHPYFSYLRRGTQRELHSWFFKKTNTHNLYPSF